MKDLRIGHSEKESSERGRMADTHRTSVVYFQTEVDEPMGVQMVTTSRADVSPTVSLLCSLSGVFWGVDNHRLFFACGLAEANIFLRPVIDVF